MAGGGGAGGVVVGWFAHLAHESDKPLTLTLATVVDNSPTCLANIFFNLQSTVCAELV